MVYYDPRRKDHIHITDTDGENVRAIPRLPVPDAWDPDPEEYSEAARLVSAHDKPARELYREMQSRFIPPIRQVVLSPSASTKARRMREESSKLVEKLKVKTEDERRREEEEIQEECERRFKDTLKFEQENAIWTLSPREPNLGV
jgi:hypothetical protein